MSGTLFLVPTPLGDLHGAGILPASVLETVARLDYVIAENPKSARAFLKVVDAIVPLSHRLQDIEIARLDVSTAPDAWPALLVPLNAGRDGALVSDAGSPAIADPGAGLVRLAHQAGIRVRPMVGPSSILLALMASGLEGQRFAFNGYLPIASGARTGALKAFESASRAADSTQVFIETPYRNEALLDTCVKTLRDDTYLCIAADLTLETEQIICRSVGEWKRGELCELKNRPTIFLLLGRH